MIRNPCVIVVLIVTASRSRVVSRSTSIKTWENNHPQLFASKQVARERAEQSVAIDGLWPSIRALLACGEPPP